MRIRREIGEKGQVVIPRDIRELLGLKQGSSIVFEINDREVKIRPEKNAEEIVEDFFNVPKIKKKLTQKEIKKAIEQQYELS